MSDLKRLLAWLQAKEGSQLLPLRVFLGFTFCFAGLQKLANPNFFRASAIGSFQSQLLAAANGSPIHPLLKLVMHAPVPIAVSIAIGEVAVGLGTFTGLFARLAAAAGMLLSLSFFLTISFHSHPYYYGADIVFLFAWTPLALGGAGALSLDAALAERARRQLQAAPTASTRTGAGGPESVERRALILRGWAVGVTAVVGGVLIGVVTAVSRSVGGTKSPSRSSSASAGNDAKKAPGTKIALASAVPVGGALAFTDPAQQIPAYIVQPTAGEYRAFSRICTHEQCTVAFVRSTETFDCPCHGSVYNASTGAVIQGPAPLPLPPIPVRKGPGDALFVDT